MDGKRITGLRADARKVVADYEPDCGEEAFEEAVARLAAIGFRMSAMETPSGPRPRGGRIPAVS